MRFTADGVLTLPTNPAPRLISCRFPADMPETMIHGAWLPEFVKGGDETMLTLRDLRTLVQSHVGVNTVEAVYRTPAAQLRYQAEMLEQQERLIAKVVRFIACVEHYWKEP